MQNNQNRWREKEWERMRECGWISWWEYFLMITFYGMFIRIICFVFLSASHIPILVSVQQSSATNRNEFDCSPIIADILNGNFVPFWWVDFVALNHINNLYIVFNIPNSFGYSTKLFVNTKNSFVHCTYDFSAFEKKQIFVFFY